MSSASRIGSFLTVAIVAAACAFGVHAVYNSYEARVARNEQAYELRHLAELIPPALHDNDLANDAIVVRHPELLGGDAPRTVYRAFDDGQPVAAIIQTVAPDGYAGSIELLVGIYADGRVAGVRVTQHQETPGLGDQISLAESDWLLGFDDRSLGDPPRSGWQVKKNGGEFDQFTGATVSPRAVVTAVRDALIYFDAHSTEIFATGPDSTQ